MQYALCWRTLAETLVRCDLLLLLTLTLTSDPRCPTTDAYLHLNRLGNSQEPLP